MKQAIISGLKKKLLLVELSESANRLSIFNDEQPYLSYFIGHDTQRFYLPGKCVLIGKLTDIKEEQFIDFVHTECTIYNEKGYTNYNTPLSVFDTAKESFFSKLEADGLNYFDINKTYLFEIL